ncbi:MAG: hypothetical protein ACXU8A_08045 [Burkholderiaceae bacterium]
MKDVIIKSSTEKDFFKRGRAVAKLADQGAQFAEEKIISFEDPEDVLPSLTTAQQLTCIETTIKKTNDSDFPGDA